MQNDLVTHWQPVIPQHWIAGPWEEAHRHCWRCWVDGPLQRCHIVPASRGGADEPRNLILLCTRCHREQPNVRTPQATWTWLRSTLHSGAMRFAEEWLAAYEFSYGEEPLTQTVADPERFGARLSAELVDAVAHWGDGRLNPATIAACVRKAEGRA